MTSSNISMEQVKALRDKTGISIMQCKKALEDAQGDEEKAIIFLRKKGAEIVSTSFFLLQAERIPLFVLCWRTGSTSPPTTLGAMRTLC